MGLDIKVVNHPSKSCRFGPYSKFTRFRADLATYTHGGKFGKEYAQWVSRPPSFIADMMTPAMLEQLGGGNQELSPEFKALDIWPIYCLSDASAEITQKECTDLFNIMKKHKKVLRKKNVDEEFKESYKQLMEVFAAGKGDSDDVSVIFG